MSNEKCCERNSALFSFQAFKFQRKLLLLGHAGLGGQNIRIDRVNGLTFAYVSNGLKVLFHSCRLRFLKMQKSPSVFYEQGNIVVDTSGNTNNNFETDALQGGLGDRARTYVRIIDALYRCIPVKEELSE